MFDFDFVAKHLIESFSMNVTSDICRLKYADLDHGGDSDCGVKKSVLNGEVLLQLCEDADLFLDMLISETVNPETEESELGQVIRMLETLEPLEMESLPFDYKVLPLKKFTKKKSPSKQLYQPNASTYSDDEDLEWQRARGAIKIST